MLSRTWEFLSEESAKCHENSIIMLMNVAKLRHSNPWYDFNSLRKRWGISLNNPKEQLNAENTLTRAAPHHRLSLESVPVCTFIHNIFCSLYPLRSVQKKTCLETDLIAITPYLKLAFRKLCNKRFGELTSIHYLNNLYRLLARSK